MNRSPSPSRRVRSAFSLVELLVVIGIIALLIAILLPSLSRARQQANSVKCQANLRTLGQMLRMYENENRGYLYPVGPDSLLTGRPSTLGTNVAPHERWPMKVFKVAGAPFPPPYDPATYVPVGADKLAQIQQMQAYPAEKYTPEVLVCPSDLEPWDNHSYVLNSHLSDKGVKAGSHNFGGLTSSEVIIAGEKKTTERDYYMEAGPNALADNSEFSRVVEPQRHGLRLGSNYLYHDGHVGTLLPRAALTGIDPWDLREPTPTTVTPPA